VNSPVTGWRGGKKKTRKKRKRGTSQKTRKGDCPKGLQEEMADPEQWKTRNGWAGDHNNIWAEPENQKGQEGRDWSWGHAKSNADERACQSGKIRKTGKEKRFRTNRKPVEGGGGKKKKKKDVGTAPIPSLRNQ